MSLLESVQLPLDHASMAVESLSDAIGVLDRLLGLSVTVSPEDPGRHGRVFLDRSYIEVSVQADIDAWSVSLFFLGFEDPDALRTHLERAELDFRWGEYNGVDGTWDDVEVIAGQVPMPILVRRTSPPEVAADWPPALTKPHRSGARTLAAVHLTVPDLGSAREAYARLLGPGSNPIVLVEGADVGISGVVFGVRSHDETRDVLGDILSDPDEDGVSWVNSNEITGVRFGFVTQLAR